MLKKIAILIIFIFWVTPLYSYNRNFKKYPSIKTIENASRIVAISDIHGGLFQAVNTLEVCGILKLKKGVSFGENEAYEILSPEDYNKFFKYSGGKSIIVIVGDLVSRGNWSREVIDLAMFLKEKSIKQGGNTIVLLGNHEIRILDGETEENAHKKNKMGEYKTVIQSFERAGINNFETYDDMIKPDHLYGKWLRDLPMAAIVNDIFFVHAGIKPYSNMEKLKKKFRKSVVNDNWTSKIMRGKRSPFWIRKFNNGIKKIHWWKNLKDIQNILNSVNCKFMVVGHSPGAFGKKGKVGIRYNILFDIDVGMTPSKGYSSGGGLIITYNKKNIIFTIVESDKNGCFYKKNIFYKK